MTLNVKELLGPALKNLTTHYEVVGIIDRSGRIYPLGTDTKVLSTIFELIVRPLIYYLAAHSGYGIVEPTVQNYYPDFTLHRGEDDHQKIAIDVKTTYRDTYTARFSYTLGGYTSFIREGKESKNIVFPFPAYAEHWIIGFVYRRIVKKKGVDLRIYEYSDLEKMQLPFEEVDVFVQEKWRIASDRAGSGNTTNIGSIMGTLEDFENGCGVFSSQEEFLGYWRNYGRTKSARVGMYNNISEYRDWISRL